MSSTEHASSSSGTDRGGRAEETAFTSLLEDSAEDLYENAPCGYLSTLMDGQIAKINGTLLAWLGYTRDELVGRCPLTSNIPLCQLTLLDWGLLPLQFPHYVAVRNGA
ncbi:MAG: hypothetical protein ACRDRJ_40730 [Streptosporangiaceae bacterium]